MSDVVRRDAKWQKQLCTGNGNTCTKFAQGNTKRCIEHGGGNRCEEPGCTKSAIGNTKRCVEHGGGNRCEEPGCTKSARGNTKRCVEHGGGNRCEEPGCTKSAIGNTKRCKGHGGGNRCEEPGCTKSARGNTKRCIEHGGGNRCEEPGCTKSAQGNTKRCIEHGGGNRCEEPGCTKSAQGNTKRCIEHGGGNRCASCELVSVKRDGFLCYVCRVGTERMKQLELMVKTHLESNERTSNFSYYDQTLPCAPNRRRPDFVYILQDRIVIIECDENCHRHYNRDCEIARITELMEQCGSKPLVLIRFNPKERCLPQLTHEALDAFTCDLQDQLFTCKFVAYQTTAEYDPVEEIEKLSRKRRASASASASSSDSGQKQKRVRVGE